MSTVLVTGGSGFIGSHCLVQLLAAGHHVRTTVRSPSRAHDVHAMLTAAGVVADDRLAVVEADLTSDRGWPAAVEGCDFVLHVASPLPYRTVAANADLLEPAREGTRRVLRAAREAGVRRVVLTSSFGAVSVGHASRQTPFDETCWTTLESNQVSNYVRSKTLAERAAWDFASEGGPLELAVVNPVGAFGPFFRPRLSISIGVIQRLLNGDFPACPRLYFNIVDVRDVADLHLRAMTHPAAAGERFIAAGDRHLSLLDIATILRRRLGPKAARVPRWPLPDWVVRASAPLIPRMRRLAPQLGAIRVASNAKAKRVLAWQPRAAEDSIVATAEGLIRYRLVR